jgi:hypothetical protein
MKKTAVEWLAEKYNYITWMRNRDEMSAGTADECRAKYLEQAKEMEKERMIEFARAYLSCHDMVDKIKEIENNTTKTYGGNK